ncbi:MAG TPA: ABC transporter permease [Silvibacterium sp.]|nr:ABC transporter permease [Silvibacterium sp.]
MQTILHDIRYALRQLRKSPGFTLVAVLTLALGIGANTAIYSVIHGALRLPYPNAERMIAIKNVYPQGSYPSASYPDFEDWQARTRTFSHLGARFNGQMTWIGKGEPQTVNVGYATRDYFSVFSMEPVAGRIFLPSEHQKGAAPVCMLSETFWQEQLGRSLSAIGSSLNLNGRACTVVGVVPVPRPSGAQPAQVWIPLEPQPPYIEHGTNYLFPVGVLRPGVTPAQARTELAGIQTQIDKQFPDNTHGVNIVPLQEFVFGNLRSIMLVLQAAVGFILLIACVNLANMLLARAADREREFALRKALGASPRRMLQQALTESLLLSLSGGFLGLLIAEGLLHVPIDAWPKGFVPPSDVHLDATVLAFTSVLAIGTGVLFGIMPALRILRHDEKQALQQGRTVTESREQNRTRSALVIAEIALSMLLVAGSINMALYFRQLLNVDPGVNTQHVLTMAIGLSPVRYSKPEDQQRFFDNLQEKLAALPGVKAAAGSADLPLAGANSNGDFDYEGSDPGAQKRLPFAERHFVTPGYFAAIQTPLFEGRDFTRHDQVSSQKVIIINRDMAQLLWPGRSALGKHVKFSGEWHEVIGIAADAHFNGPGTPAGLQMYVSADQYPQSFLSMILRTVGDPLALTEPARRAVSSIDPGQAVSNVTSLQSLADSALAGQRTSTTVTAILGCLALLLASIGVYGVMAYSVSRREREFGIRMALGANRSNILTLLFSGVFRLVLVGMVVGTMLVIAMRAWVASVLGASGANPVALIVAALLLCIVAAVATYIPARRATQVQPMQALRTE